MRRLFLSCLKFSHLRYRSSRNQTDQGENLSSFELLPEDVLNLVIDLLDPFEYLNFRAVSRRCRSVAPLEKCRSLLKNDIVSPWLILPNPHKRSTRSRTRSTRSISIVDPRFGRERECYVTLPLQIPTDARFRYALNRYLIMSSANFFIEYDPLNKRVDKKPWDATVLVPLLDPLLQFVLESPDHKLLIQSTSKDQYIMINQTILRARSREADNSFEHMFLPRIPYICEESYLVACDGEALIVHVGEAGKLVKVVKILDVQLRCNMPWGEVVEEVKDLGNKCLFLSNSSSMSAVIPGMKNRIYFSRFYRNSMIYYSMETGKLHYSLLREGSIVEESMKDFRGADEHYLHSSCWLEPRRNL